MRGRAGPSRPALSLPLSAHSQCPMVLPENEGPSVYNQQSSFESLLCAELRTPAWTLQGQWTAQHLLKCRSDGDLGRRSERGARAPGEHDCSAQGGSKRLHREGDLRAGNMKQIIKKWQTGLPRGLGTVLCSHEAEELVCRRGRGRARPRSWQRTSGGQVFTLSPSSCFMARPS